MGDTRAEGERNFWNGKESVTANQKSIFNPKPVNALVSFFRKLFLSLL